MSLLNPPSAIHQDSDTVINALVAKQFSRVPSLSTHSDVLSWLTARLLPLHKNNTVIVSLIGGAAAGKTTMTKELVAALQARGVRADTIGTDDFVIGTREYRRQNLEGRDPRAKYDFNYMNSLITRIRQNNDPAVFNPVPEYNEQSGVALAAGEAKFPRRIGKVDFLIVGGDFDEVHDDDAALYLHVPDKVRLQNRLDRDLLQRNEADQSPIVANFELRQRLQHFPYTLPAAERCSVILCATPDSSKQYQFTVYQKRA